VWRSAKIQGIENEGKENARKISIFAGVRKCKQQKMQESFAYFHSLYILMFANMNIFLS